MLKILLIMKALKSRIGTVEAPIGDLLDLLKPSGSFRRIEKIFYE